MNTLPFVLVSGPLCPGMCLRKTKHSSQSKHSFLFLTMRQYVTRFPVSLLCIIHAATVKTVLYSLVPHVCCL